MNRRDVLRLGATTLGAAALAPAGACAPDEPAPTTPFSSGVASGLHSTTAVVLWTRVDPRVEQPATVRWEISDSPSMDVIIRSGTANVDPNADSCVKVLVDDLPPDAVLWYRFSTDSVSSAVGRARTLPRPGDAGGDNLRLAFASCQHFSAGFYEAWQSIADSDLDAVVFLGDYIYEVGTGPFGVRWEPFGVARTRADYHAKYRLYRTDTQLQAAHAAHPLVPVWDDHEVFNDHDRFLLAEDPTRADAAHQAWFDYMPVWPRSGFEIHRSLRWGTLANLTMLDTRQYRDAHFPGQLIGTLLDERFTSAERSLLGAAQRDWFLSDLDDAERDGVTWKLVGNQVMVAPIRYIDLDEPALRALVPDLPKHAGFYSSMDSWDGFPVERDRVLGHIAGQGIRNVNFLTGDVHAFFAASVQQDFDDPASPLVANEFTVGAISSSPGGVVEALIEAANDGRLNVSPSFAFTDLYRNGFGTLEATPGSMTVRFLACSARDRDVPRLSAAFEVTADTPGFRRV